MVSIDQKNKLICASAEFILTAKPLKECWKTGVSIDTSLYDRSLAGSASENKPFEQECELEKEESSLGSASDTTLIQWKTVDFDVLEAGVSVYCIVISAEGC